MDMEKSVKGSRILVMGLAYKPDVDDTRESPSFELIGLLEERGAEVEYTDPFIPRNTAGKAARFEDEERRTYSGINRVLRRDF